MEWLIQVNRLYECLKVSFTPKSTAARNTFALHPCLTNLAETSNDKTLLESHSASTPEATSQATFCLESAHPRGLIALRNAHTDYVGLVDWSGHGCMTKTRKVLAGIEEPQERWASGRLG